MGNFKNPVGLMRQNLLKGSNTKYYILVVVRSIVALPEFYFLAGKN
jgi:hypothetical protein